MATNEKTSTRTGSSTATFRAKPLTEQVVTIHRVDSTPVWKLGVTRHLVTAVESNDHLTQFETIDPLLASLCERAQVKGRRLKVTWQPSPYGKQLVGAELTEDAA